VSIAVVRWLNPLVWSLPGNVARKLAGFAATEAESVLEMRAAAALTTDATRRALYLEHALDEARHARVFARAASDAAVATGNDIPGHPTHVTPEDLFERLGETRFLAYVHLGERRGRRQFETYRDHFTDRAPHLSTMFQGLLVDELRHETYTFEQLVLVAGSLAGATRELRRAAAWEAWRTWLRLGRTLTAQVYFVLMLVVYVAIAPFAWVFGRARSRPTRFRSASPP